jgi:hypothetical protein
MEQEHNAQSRQLVDDILRTYQLGRDRLALEKIQQALLHPEELTEEHLSLLQKAQEQLSLRFPSATSSTAPKGLVQIPGHSVAVPDATEPILQLPSPGDTLTISLNSGFTNLGTFEGKRVMVRVDLKALNLKLNAVITHVYSFPAAGPMVFADAVPDEPTSD